MISRRVVWAMRDARRRLGQSDDLFLTRPFKRRSEPSPDLPPEHEPERPQLDDSSQPIDDRCVEEPVAQTVSECEV